MASFSIGCMTCSSIVARCMDRTRKLKRLTIILLTTSIVGNILYTITYSVWFPIFGRLLCGMTNTIRSCYMGEISRTHRKEEFTKIITLYEIAGNIASAISPVTPALFAFMHFNITAGWVIRQENAIGLILACMTTLLLVYSVIFLKDLSVDPVFPEIQKKHFPNQMVAASNNNNNNNDNNDNNNNNNNNNDTHLEDQGLLTFRDILQNDGIMVFLTYMFVSATQHYQLDLLTNMVAIMDFQYSISQYGIIVAIATALMCVSIYFIQKMMTSSLDTYFLSINNLVWIIIAQTLVSLSLWIKSWASNTLGFITVGLVVLLNYLHGTITIICVKQILFKLTPSHSASIIDSYRFNSLIAAVLIAFFTASYVFMVKDMIMPIYNLLSYLLIIYLIVYRKKYLKLLED
eukprot:TCONS_00008695-protein